jgi:hypothetical protein
MGGGRNAPAAESGVYWALRFILLLTDIGTINALAFHSDRDCVSSLVTFRDCERAPLRLTSAAACFTGDK